MSKRSIGANNERKAIKLYRGLGFKTFNPVESMFAPKLPWGDFIFFNDTEIGFCEVRTNKRSHSEQARRLKESGLPIGAVLADLIIFESRKGYEFYQWNGDAWISYNSINDAY